MIGNLNSVKLVGNISKNFQLDHEVLGEKFCLLEVGIPRHSGNVDVIPVIVSQRLIMEDFSYKDKVTINGTIRSHNIPDEKGINHLRVYVFANEIHKSDKGEPYVNEIHLEGFLAKEPVNRVTPMGRIITDLFIATNKSFNKSYYIPAIAWGRNATYIKIFSAGTKIEIIGRLQSRTYTNQEQVTRTVLETSIRTLEVL